jgi:excisionase family DNA binding protein
VTALLTVTDAARTLGVSVDTVRRMTVTGELTPVRMSHRIIRVRRVDVERLTGLVTDASTGDPSPAPGAHATHQPTTTNAERTP